MHRLIPTIRRPIQRPMRQPYKSLLLVGLMLLNGCSLLNSSKPDAPVTSASTVAANPVDSTPTTAPPIQYRQFPIDTLYSLLVAEVAASRQQFDVTLDNYVSQANLTNDKNVIARSARIAQFFRAKQESLDMGLLWLQHEPNNTETITLVANAYLELNQPLKALDYTERLLTDSQSTDGQTAGATKKDNGALMETIANFSKQANDETLDTLIQRFLALSIRYPELAGIKVGLSVLHQSKKAIDPAFRWIHQALKQEPKRTTAIIQEILLLQQNQQTELAITKLNTQLERDPTNSRLRLIYARLLTQTDTNKAYEQFTQLSEQSPNQLDLVFSRALIATELKKLDAAQPLFEKLLAANYRPDTIRFYLGHIAEAQEQLDSAVGYYLSVTQGDDFVPAHNRAARIMIRQGKLTQAQTLFKDLRAQFPKQVEQFYVTESDLLIRSKHANKALTLLNAAIKQFPDNTSLRYNRSTVYEKQDQLALMESDLQHIINIDPNNASALNGLGYFLTTRTQRFDEALSLIERALVQQPNDPAIIDSMGWVLFKLGRIKEAISYLQKAFDRFPDPEVAAHLGEALWADGQQQEAKTLLRGNLEANPDAPEIINILKRLDISL